MDREIYEKWLQNATNDPEIVQELKSIQLDENAIAERFYRDLEFGTGGLRGIIGAGSNRMNSFTVKKATQGLSLYLQENYKNSSVAIAYDSRKNSLLFARAAAEVLAQNGSKVYIFGELTPTPMLSFAVRYLQASAGIVITASHNPAKYNGYKVYGSDGCQITLAAAQKITGHITAVDMFAGVFSGNYDVLVKKGMIQTMLDGVSDAYYKEVLKQSVFDAAGSGLRVVYSPLNGAGNKPVRRILKEIGIDDVIPVPEQENPDSTFTTCPYPNPEEAEALKLAVRLAEETNADIVLATDPDCDRVGAAAKHNGSYVLINGNQMGVMLLDFICKMRKESGKMPVQPVVIKTIVTSEMAQAIANHYEVELVNVLTGFKFIGEQIGFLEEKGEESRFVFGFEESYGYLAGSYVRDKDAVVASMLICQMAAYYRKFGLTIIDALENLYLKYGFYFEKLESYAFDGISGIKNIQKIMKNLRENPPSYIGELRVRIVRDYLLSKQYENGVISSIQLPSSDVMGFFIDGDSSVIVRPSGTEPKLKIYYSLKCDSKMESEVLFKKVVESMNGLLKV